MEEDGTTYQQPGQEADYVIFTLNGKTEKVCDLPPTTSLLTYIRDHAHLTGTKFMCKEGGCGACIVNITINNPATKIEKPLSVNSCLYPLYACHGSAVTTVEGIGSKQHGYHPVQQRLAHFYGTQCGYCSPGWVMAMYSLLKTNPNLTMKEIEESLGSNVCRCTGYRPILDAFKSFAVDSSKELKQRVKDIEDLAERCVAAKGPCFLGCKECVRKHDDDVDLCRDFVEIALSKSSLKIPLENGSTWFRVTSVKEIFEIFDMVTTYMLVGGNTAQGVFEFKYPTPPEAYIDIRGVEELHAVTWTDGSLRLGANMTLTDTALLFRKVAIDNPKTYSYLNKLAKHIDKIGHIPLRNVGTLAGSLSTKYANRRFESDIFTIFEAVHVKLIIVSLASLTETVSLPEYLDMDMHQKVIKQIQLSPLDSNSYFLNTYKVAKIAQNSHAYVNAGFLFKFSSRYEVTETPQIVYGGISKCFIHAKRTESFLVGKALLDNAVLQEALSILDSEVLPDRRLPQASDQYRKGLALSLFYKYVLSVNPELVSAKYRSGAEEIERPLSSGSQDFSTDPSLYPNNEPLPKLESLIQCSGEAEYTYDLPVAHTELFAALVITNRGPAVIQSVDPSPALMIKGVEAFFDVKDIPGRNSFIYPNIFSVYYEELFAEDVSQYAGQPVGVVVASSQDLANLAASRVVIRYANQEKPLLTVQEVLASGRHDKIIPHPGFIRKKTKNKVQHVVKGDFHTSGQYAYHMETQTCVVHPTAEGLDIHAATQAAYCVNEGVAIMLNLPSSSITLTVGQIGGGYGSKILRANMAANACALAAYLLQRPVRIILPMETNMKAIGIRKPIYFQYEAGVDDEGEIQYINGNYYEDVGIIDAEYQFPNSQEGLAGYYNTETWDVTISSVITDKATNCWVRSPGALTGFVCTENLMEHIAKTVNQDPLKVRLRNLSCEFAVLFDMVEELKATADYEDRTAAVESFNNMNVWKKRGISVLPMRYTLGSAGSLHALVSIYRKDGTVAITHGGIEMGQGVNTQAAQTCARQLGVPLHYIQVKPSYNIASPNAIGSGGSITGETVVVAVTKCCETLNARLEPIRQSLVNPSWEQLIQEAYRQNVDLNAVCQFNLSSDGKTYAVTGVGISEVEIDCLTGESSVIRTDILIDAGESVNPFIDIGQAEGAFVMGQGFLTCEQLIYDEDTGYLTTNRSWDYKVPQAKDIPTDLRIYLKKNSVNVIGPTRAKGMGEPPIQLSWSVVTAIRYAVTSVHRDLGYPDTFFKFEPPATPENIFLTCKTRYQDYLL